MILLWWRDPPYFQPNQGEGRNQPVPYLAMYFLINWSNPLKFNGLDI